MRVIVCYDISSGKRLRKTAKILRKYGKRVEKSVFECEINHEEYQRLRMELNAAASGKDLVLAYCLPDHVLPDWIFGNLLGSKTGCTIEKTVCFFEKTAE